MIKLFLITLLCATLVFADSSIQDFEDARKQSMHEFHDMANHFTVHSSLVRRSPQIGGQGGAQGGAQAGFGMEAKAEGEAGGEGGFGEGFKGGFEGGFNMGAGAGAGAGGAGK
ncbi:uncharacterized protein [Anoplolepis gracilipes]|uniref:uncharacterized protein n=1 Tax=Anoplolepis gracilipes TaxID=354296 RepID=UPI003BA0BCBF